MEEVVAAAVVVGSAGAVKISDNEGELKGLSDASCRRRSSRTHYTSRDSPAPLITCQVLARVHRVVLPKLSAVCVCVYVYIIYHIYILYISVCMLLCVLATWVRGGVNLARGALHLNPMGAGVVGA